MISSPYILALLMFLLESVRPTVARVLHDEKPAPFDRFQFRSGGDQAEGFYDIVYDADNACPNGLRAKGVKGYVYIDSQSNLLHNVTVVDCLLKCFAQSECKSINFYDRPLPICQLNQEDQWDDPSKLVPYPKTLYYDQINCNS